MSKSDSNSRLTEKLIALLRYEMENGRGCDCSELIEEVLADTRQAIVCQFDGDEDLTAKQIERIDRDVMILADHLVMALMETDHADDAESLIDNIANRRRECDAKFGSPRMPPFSHREREELAKQWDARSVENRKARTNEVH